MAWGRCALTVGFVLAGGVLSQRQALKRPANGRVTWAASYGYRLQPVGDERSRITIYNRQTGVSIWQCSVSFVHHAVWSRDRRAFALADDGPPDSTESMNRLIVWRAGE